MKTVITLEDNKLPKIEYEQGQIKQSFNVSLESLIESIHDSFQEVQEVEERVVVKDKVALFSRALPTNTVKYGQLESGDEFIILSHPAEQYDVKYHDTVFKNVGFPNLAFVLLLGEKSVKGKYVFCYKDRFLRDTTEMYMYPYANVFGAGNMCFYPGNYELQDLVQLQTWPELWRTADMNDHLYHPKRTTMNTSLRELLQTFEGNPFDHNILDMKFGTLGELHAKVGIG